MAMLKRKKAESVKDEDYAGIKQLAAECKELLGYDLLNRTMETTRPCQNLVAALKELDIRPFSEKSVRKYKKRQEWFVKMHDAQAAVEWTFSRLACTLGGIAVLSALTWLTLSLTTGGGGWCFWLAIPGAIGGLLSLVAYAIARSNSSHEVHVYWSTRKLSSYSDPVPEFALQTACDIKRKCPDVDFLVDEIQCNRISLERRKDDPFLVVRDKTGHDYYVEVWNEPKFHKTYKS